MSHPTFLARPLQIARVDFPTAGGRPAALRVLVATVVAVVGSLLADALLVAAGKALFPTTHNYQHYQFGDYSKLTIIGVLIACAAWPLVTRISSAPTWIFSRLAVLVTLVLLLPDVWLLVNHQPGQAVAVLVVMHLAIAVVTYFSLVRIAPARTRTATAHAR